MANHALNHIKSHLREVLQGLQFSEASAKELLDCVETELRVRTTIIDPGGPMAPAMTVPERQPCEACGRPTHRVCSDCMEIQGLLMSEDPLPSREEIRAEYRMRGTWMRWSRVSVELSGEFAAEDLALILRRLYARE